MNGVSYQDYCNVKKKLPIFFSHIRRRFFRQKKTGPVSEGRHHQPLLGTQVLELVVEVDIGDGNHASAVVVNVVRGIRPPVEARLATGVGMGVGI